MFVDVPSRRRPRVVWITPLLVLVSVGAFVYITLQEPAARIELMRRWGAIRPLDAELETYTLILRWVPSLFTALLIHADWIHLIGNLLFLLIFGLPAERTLSAWRFLLLFGLGGALANLTAALLMGEPGRVIIGASGGVSAVIGAYLALFPTARLGVVVPLGLWLEFIKVPAALLIGLWATLQLVFTYVGPSFGAVAWWAHLGGFVVGAVFALLLRPTLARRARGT